MVLKLVLTFIVIFSLINSIRCICTGSQATCIHDKLDELCAKMREEFDSCLEVTCESCEAIKAANPDSTSGDYVIEVDGEERTVYCNFDTLCGSSDGWMRVAHFDMTDTSTQCPSGFTLQTANEKRACGRDSIGCHSINIPSIGSYSEVCGRVHAYQFQHLDGITGHPTDIDQVYVDGVSITRGSPRQHIWTFIGSLGENDNAYRVDCPCGGASVSPPDFVGSDYYCESGNPGPGHTSYYTDDKLWDGQQCGNIETGCCTNPMLPYFYKNIGSSTTDDIELRVCSDEVPGGEDPRLIFYEIYVK